MKKTKQDIQLDLLKELDDICKANNLSYILFGNNALNAYKNQTIKDGSLVVSVAMTQGEAEKFCKIIEETRSNDRYVEGLFNNPRYNQFYIAFGNKNTTDYPIERGNYNRCFGICINIYFIKKRIGKDGTVYKEWTTPLKLERKIRRFLSIRVESNKLWFAKLGLKFADFLYLLTGGGYRFYRQLRKRVYIDKWEDIQKYDEVRIGQSGSVSASCLSDLREYNVDGISVSMPKDADTFFSSFFGEEFEELEIKMKQLSSKTLFSVSEGYENILQKYKGELKEARALREEILWNRLKVKNARDTVDSVWTLVHMTEKQLEYQDFFEKNLDRLKEYDMDDEDQFEKLYEEVKPVISCLNKYRKKGMTFSISDEADDFLQSVLKKRGYNYLICGINKLLQKDIYVK